MPDGHNNSNTSPILLPLAGPSKCLSGNKLSGPAGFFILHLFLQSRVSVSTAPVLCTFNLEAK